MSIVEAAGGDVLLVIGGGGVVLVVVLAVRNFLPQVPWFLAALLSIATVFKADPVVHERCLRMLRRFEPGLKAGKSTKLGRSLIVRAGPGAGPPRSLEDGGEAAVK